MTTHLPPRATVKPRVCLITESYYPIIGGGETQSRTTAEDLVERGFGVIVATRQTKDIFKTYEEMGEIRIYRVPPQGSGHLKRWLIMPRLLALLIRHRQAFDTILVCGYRSLGIVAVVVSQLCNKNCILKADNNGEMSGEFFAGGLKKWNLSLSSWPVQTFVSLRNQLFKKADAFVSISSQITREFIQSDVPPSKVHFIPNSVDTSRFHPVSKIEKGRLRQQLGLPLAGPIVIYTGRLMSVKGLPLLLEAWREIQDEADQSKRLGATLLLVGGGSKDIHDCESELKAYVSQHQLAGSVIFTGDVNNVDEYLKAADVFVFPPLNEAFGISVIEAMACELPVIGTAAGGLIDIVTPQESGILFEVGSLEQLKQAIITLITSPDQAQTFGKAAAKTVQARYTREAVAQLYADLLSETLLNGRER